MFLDLLLIIRYSIVHDHWISLSRMFNCMYFHIMLTKIRFRTHFCFVILFYIALHLQYINFDQLLYAI